MFKIGTKIIGQKVVDDNVFTVVSIYKAKLLEMKSKHNMMLKMDYHNSVSNYKGTTDILVEQMEKLIIDNNYRIIDG